MKKIKKKKKDLPRDGSKNDLFMRSVQEIVQQLRSKKNRMSSNPEKKKEKG